MKDKMLLYVISAIVLVMLGFTIKKELSIDGIAYIDIEKLVNEYQFKKDLEKDAGNNLYKIKLTIDSLEMIRKTIADLQPTRIDTQLGHAKYVFDKYYDESTKAINKSIWERLNPIIEQYGKEHNLELLIGANGAGTLLYAKKRRDMTNDLVEYINRKYEMGN